MMWWLRVPVCSDGMTPHFRVVKEQGHTSHYTASNSLAAAFGSVYLRRSGSTGYWGLSSPNYSYDWHVVLNGGSAGSGVYNSARFGNYVAFGF